MFVGSFWRLPWRRQVRFPGGVWDSLRFSIKPELHNTQAFACGRVSPEPRKLRMSQGSALQGKSQGLWQGCPRLPANRGGLVFRDFRGMGGGLLFRELSVTGGGGLLFRSAG